jgi:hypothetical protein
MFSLLLKIHRTTSSIIRMLCLLIVCIVGNILILTQSDVSLLYVLALGFSIWSILYNVEMISYILIKYLLYNDYEIRYIYGKNYEEFQDKAE